MINFNATVTFHDLALWSSDLIYPSSLFSQGINHVKFMSTDLVICVTAMSKCLITWLTTVAQHINVADNNDYAHYLLTVAILFAACLQHTLA